MTEKKIIGNVTANEAKEIKVLYERKTALYDLKLTVDDCSEDIKNELYLKIQCDMENVDNIILEWWQNKAEKYNWQKNKSAYVDFRTGEVCEQ